QLTPFAAFEPEGRDAPVVREDGSDHALAEFQAADRAVAPSMPAGPARAGADAELAQQYGVAQLEHFGIREARVGHVRLHGRRTVKVGSRARAAGDRLVVLVAIVAE